MQTFQLGPVESRFADIVWETAPITTAELVKLCGEALNWKRTTTYTVLKKMTQRQIFQLDDGIVRVLVSREDFYASQSCQVVEENFSGSLPAFVAAFTRHQRLTDEEIKLIRAMIDSAREV